MLSASSSRLCSACQAEARAWWIGDLASDYAAIPTDRNDAGTPLLSCFLKANLGNEHFCVLFARAERMWDSSESITAFRQKTAAKLYSQIKRVSTPVCGVRSLDCNAPCFAYSNTRYF